ncbi:MAG: hypothetical protein K6A69_07595 [Lachnospiraceae bacterium]|nr:hypothetical protein [Lachnospiraceae bacterium]
MIDGKAYTKRTMIMKEFKQPLFLKDHNPQDIRQGNVGDCFFYETGRSEPEYHDEELN